MEHSKDVRRLYRTDKNFQSIANWLAKLDDYLDETTIERMAVEADLKVASVLECFRKLHDMGVGTLILGRKGNKSRFQWSVDPREIGSMALGSKDNSHRSKQDLSNVPTSSKTEVKDGSLTIKRAKELLAASLGVDEDAIEITIRA
jgi:hypothetical protein